MNIKLEIYFFTLLIALLISRSVSAQFVPVGSFQEEQMQIQRLLADSIVVSPVMRPYSMDQYNRLMSANKAVNGWWNHHYAPSSFESGNGLELGFLPVSFKNTVNSRFPYSENNGAAWYGRGFNVEFQGGVFLRASNFTLTLQPHLIYQQNTDFLEPRFFFDKTAPYISEVGGTIDAPFRFGPNSFNTFDWGNSSLRYQYHKFESGISSEPLWWGSSNKYPLIMSNNAPGIHHFFIGSRERVRIPYFGSIHFKWMMGYPQESDYFAGEFAGKPRFLNAGNFSFSPGFYQNLTLGLTRAYHVFQVDGFDFSHIFLLFDPIRRSSLVARQGEDETRQARNQIASIYVHLSLPAANAEIYAEFFREDHSFDFRDLFVQPHHNSAYSLGLRKISYAPYFDFVQTHLEFTNLTASQLNQVRPQAYFYSHDPIMQGHTNRGQILGAAIGPGSNSQFLSIKGYKNNYSLGLFAQRVVNNDNLHFQVGSVRESPFREFGDYFRHNVHLNIGFDFLYRHNKIILDSQIVWTKSFNYGRLEAGNFNGVTIQNYNKLDRVNVQLQFGLTYLF